MRVPNLAGLVRAINVTEPSGIPLLSPVDIDEATKRPRNHPRALSVLVIPRSGDTSDQERIPHKLEERQTCASGSTYYTCSNGFGGCCARNPCDATNAVCPAATTTKKTTAKAATGTATKTATSTKKAIATASGTKTATKTSAVSGTGTAATLSATSTGSAATNASSVSLITATSSTSTSSASPSAQASSSSGSSIGAIVGGVVGGVAGLILLCVLIIFCTRRQRKKVDERKLKEKTDMGISRPVLQEPQETFIPTGHHRSRSTSHDVITPRGGIYRDPDSKTDRFSELEGHSSAAPGVRAERGIVPAAVLRPPQMLDSTLVQSPKPPSSRSSMFKEHISDISEMPDTSRTPLGPLDPGSPYSRNGESPILGRLNPGSTTSLVNQVRRNQHFMSWNNYDPHQPMSGDDEAMSATLTPRTPPSARK